MILVTHFACCHQYKGYWRSCPLGWSYFTVMPGLTLRAGGAHAPEFTIGSVNLVECRKVCHIAQEAGRFENAAQIGAARLQNSGDVLAALLGLRGDSFRDCPRFRVDRDLAGGQHKIAGEKALRIWTDRGGGSFCLNDLNI